MSGKRNCSRQGRRAITNAAEEESNPCMSPCPVKCELKSRPSTSPTDPGHGAKAAALHIVASSAFHQDAGQALRKHGWASAAQRSSLIVTAEHAGLNGLCGCALVLRRRHAPYLFHECGEGHESAQPKLQHGPQLRRKSVYFRRARGFAHGVWGMRDAH